MICIKLYCWRPWQSAHGIYLIEILSMKANKESIAIKENLTWQ